MLTYTIKKPTLIQQVGAFLLGQPKAPSHNWDKQTFTKWFETTVRGKFCIGDLITLRDISVTPNTIPFHYRIGFINELWFNVTFDSSNAEPLCLGCEGLNRSWISKAPSTMRKLTIEEVALVNLSNTKAAGSA